MYLLDTNVVSESRQARPHPGVMRTIERLPAEMIYLSTVTLGEIQSGISGLAPGRRREVLDVWFREVQNGFAGRVLPVDRAVGLLWGELTGKARRTGITVTPADGMLAATALHHRLTVVTRNVKDFEVTGVETLNPWEVR